MHTNKHYAFYKISYNLTCCENANNNEHERTQTMQCRDPAHRILHNSFFESRFNELMNLIIMG